MKKIITLSAIFVLLFVSVFVGLAYASDSPVLIRGARPLALGGAFVALSDDQNAVFYNPAGLTQRTGSQFTLFELPIAISEDVLNFSDFYNNNKDNLENFDKKDNNGHALLTDTQKISLLNDINNKVTTYKSRLQLGFPNVSYLSGPNFINWGVGLFDQADIGFNFEKSLIVPKIHFFGNADVVAAIPLAHRFDSIPYGIPGAISVGATLKYIDRARIDENMSVIEFENFDPLLQWGNGFGFDVGTLYQPNKRWNFGLQVSDLGGTSIKYAEVSSSKSGVTKPAETDMINSQWNIGTAYVPSRIYYWPDRYINTRDRLLLLFDIRDIMSTDERLTDTFWKKTHIGAEFRWATVSLRAGYNSGYMSFGIGAGIPYLGLKAEYVYWGDELGMYAGQQAQFNHQITLSFKWGGEQGRAFGNTVKNDVAKAAAAQPKKAVPVPTPVTPLPVATLTPSTTSSATFINGSQSTTTTGVQPQAAPAVTAPAVTPAAAPAAPKPAATVPAAVVTQPAPLKPAAAQAQTGTAPKNAGTQTK